MKRKFLYSEALLSKVTGISRTELVKFRKKSIPRTEWRKSKKGKGGSIELSEPAILRIRTVFRIEDANLDGARTIGSSGDVRARETEQREQPRSATPIPDSEPYFLDANGITTLTDLKLLHVSQLVPNKRILRATNGTGEVYQVIVGSSAVWAIGDPLRAKTSVNHNGYWEAVGRAPRWRGDRIYRMEFA